MSLVASVRWLLPAALLLLPVTAMAAGPAPAAPKVPGAAKAEAVAQVVAYKGKMVDEAGKPVSGIFPITFKVYAGLESKRPVWSEAMWVAVDRGLYHVRLGEKKPLPKADLTKLVLGVDIRGIGEVAREPLVAAAKVVTAATGPAKQGGGTPVAAASGSSHQAGAVKYADGAGYAVEADHAKNADRLQNLTVDDLVRKIGEEGGGGAGGGKTVKIGTARRFGTHIGGTGGVSEYNETCPKGWVMVGLKGAYGNFLDSIQIICAPLE